jgi:hypothetical protein
MGWSVLLFGIELSYKKDVGIRLVSFSSGGVGKQVLEAQPVRVGGWGEKQDLKMGGDSLR